MYRKLCAAIWLAILMLGFPAPSAAASVLPELTGPHPIGTRSFALLDPTRWELFTADRSDLRRVPVQIWYPTDRTCAPAAYFPAKLGPIYTTSMDMSAGFEASVLDHSCRDAPVAATARNLPLVLFSPGLGQDRYTYTSILEDLASHGYLVVAIDHPYSPPAQLSPTAR